MFPFASWSVLTADFLILLHLTIGGVTLAAILHLANARWRYKIRDFAVAFFSLYPLVLALLVVLLLARHGVFAWMGPGAERGGEPVHLNGWHNVTFLWVREIGGLLLVGWLFRRFIRLQAQSEESEANWERFKTTANFVPVAHVLYGTMVAWDFEMTMVPAWESSVYGAYHFISNFGMMLSTLAASAFVLNRAGRLAQPMSDTVFNYLAQMMLGFTILWTYLFFAQYLTIWYGNFPDERNRIDAMVTGDYAWLWWGFFVLKFILPFTLLVFTYIRHTPSAIYRIALLVIAGTWIERFTWIAGSVSTGAFERAQYPFTRPFDFIVTAIVLAVGVTLVLRALARSGLTTDAQAAGGALRNA